MLRVRFPSVALFGATSSAFIPAWAEDDGLNTMIRKNVAGQHLYFSLINATTGAALTGATVTGYRAIDGGAQASVTGAISEEANGQYKLALSQADTNGNQIGFLFMATGAIPRHVLVIATAADPTDAAAFGLSRLDAAVSSRSTYAGADTAGTTTLLSRIGSTLTITGGKVDVNDKTGFELSSPGGQAIWDAAVSALTTPDSVGELIVTHLDDAISSRLAGAAYTVPDNATIAAIKVKTDALPSWPTNFASLAITAGGVVQADVAKVNGYTVQGSGTVGDEWGPAP
jgi:hypothetical protein